MSKWYESAGERGDYVVSTRIRLARNLRGFPFPASMNADQKKQVVAAVRDAAEKLSGIKLTYYDPAQMPRRELLSMAERHLISPEFTRCEAGCGLLLSEDERVSIMINEEDHLRLQVLSAGLDLKGAYELADKLDTALCERLHFAFDKRLGYLTQCPTNLGTALRASLMLHLPALQERGAVQQLAATVSKLGLTIRGMYGEGSGSQGALYQLSNQVTLGISEQNALDNLGGIAEQIIKQEELARQELIANPIYEDRLFRAWGVLRTARILPLDEAMELLSALRVGVATGRIDGVPMDTVTALMTDVQPAMLMTLADADIEQGVRDQQRASLVRQALDTN